MSGKITDPELPQYGNKSIAVRKGRLEIHGTPILQTWTVLDTTANFRDKTIKV